MPPTATPEAGQVLADTRRWLERAVIGLNLCPFASAVHLRQQIRWVVSQARTEDALVEELARELRLLADADPDQVATTLLIHPWVQNDFLDYNDFLELADATVEALDLAQARVLLPRLAGRLRELDGAANDLAEAHEGLLRTALGAEGYRQFDSALQQFDFERALAALTQAARLHDITLD